MSETGINKISVSYTLQYLCQSSLILASFIYVKKCFALSLTVKRFCKSFPGAVQIISE